MKKLIVMLLLSGSIYSQDQVFNVQRYCIDEIPFKKGECDILGNEYSFVFLDSKKNEVVFFLTDMKMEYKIIHSVVLAAEPGYRSYTLENKTGVIEMKVNTQNTRIEFLFPNNHIYLTVGQSTKLRL